MSTYEVMTRGAYSEVFRGLPHRGDEVSKYLTEYQRAVATLARNTNSGERGIGRAMGHLYPRVFPELNDGSIVTFGSPIKNPDDPLCSTAIALQEQFDHAVLARDNTCPDLPILRYWSGKGLEANMVLPLSISDDDQATAFLKAVYLRGLGRVGDPVGIAVDVLPNGVGRDSHVRTYKREHGPLKWMGIEPKYFLEEPISVLDGGKRAPFRSLTMWCGEQVTRTRGTENILWKEIPKNEVLEEWTIGRMLTEVTQLSLANIVQRATELLHVVETLLGGKDRLAFETGAHMASILLAVHMESVVQHADFLIQERYMDDVEARRRQNERDQEWASY